MALNLAETRWTGVVGLKSEL